MTQSCRLYLVTPPTLPKNFAHDLAQALDAGDVAAVRLRLHAQDALGEAAATLRPIVQSRGVAFILGGDPALASAGACDGVDLLPGEMPVSSARRLIGDLQLGAFCGASRDQAMEAGDEGADYVAFGPFFTETGPAAAESAEDAAIGFDAELGLAESNLTPDLIAWWSELMELPVVAEGAITAANCAPLVQAGADFLAVGDAIWNNPEGPAAAVRAMNAAIEAAEKKSDA